MIIIGITGTLGAGKGTIVDFLIQEKGFVHYSVRALLIDEITKRGLAVNRDSMTSVANDLRTENSSSYVVDQLYIKAREGGKNCVIESIRTEGEIVSLRKKGDFYLFAIDADTDIRYLRIQIRKSETDDVSFETFLKNERRESNSDDPNKQNLQRCRELADFVFMNNESIDELHQEVENVVRSIL